MQYYTVFILYNKSIVLAIQIQYIIIEVNYMKKRVTFTLDEELLKKLKEVSEKTMIPQARLVEQAINEILKKYGK